MQNLTSEGLDVVSAIAARHGVSLDAALAVLDALARGDGRQAQFNHPDLGGMGQWSEGGMIMVGDMFNHGLKARVDALCNELAGVLGSRPLDDAAGERLQARSHSGGAGVSLFVEGARPGGQWWPAELGGPASLGAQNDLRYAYFPGPRRLAIDLGGQVRVYDSGEHRISGFSQQQSGDQSLTFTSQFGLVNVADLPLVSSAGGQSQDPAPRVEARPPRTPGSAPSAAPTAVAEPAMEEIVKTIERLAELRRKGVLTEEEFAAKKAELLNRL
jgi:hypothetical protein